jgi:transcriptional regulator
MQSIKSDCINKKIFKILVDTRQVEKKSLSNLNRFNMGVEAGKTLNSKIQVAVLDNERDINHFTELSANNRSAFVKVSSNRAELLSWLN